MPVIIQIIESADGSPCAQANCYVRDYTPDGFHGHGLLVVTANRMQAKRYTDHAAAMRDWKRVSSTHPVRRDGRPNRPLSAFTIELIHVGMNGHE